MSWFVIQGVTLHSASDSRVRLQLIPVTLSYCVVTKTTIRIFYLQLPTTVVIQQKEAASSSQVLHVVLVLLPLVTHRWTLTA